MEFTTEINNNDISIYGVYKHLDIDKETEIDDIDVSAIVRWRMDIDTREWGVKGFGIIVDSISVVGSVEYYDPKDKELEDKIYRSLEFDSSDFTIDSALEIKNDFLCPSDIEIDFETKKITIQ